MLEVIHDQEGNGRDLQMGSVLEESQRRIGARGRDAERALLVTWHDLMRNGTLAWGIDLLNCKPPFAHLTEQGRRALEKLSRDPSNPDGYLGTIGDSVPAGSIAGSYVREALATYNAGCHKAAAVMIGAASEALAVELRDELVGKFTAARKAVPKELSDWRIKPVLEAIETQVSARSAALPKDLRERFGGFWAGFTTILRMARNDAGHPASVEPVNEPQVHSSLLIFPELARLIVDLRRWVATSFVP
ncbi:MAG: hypothetical protein QM723_34325 [Myxococcaceae bacterium]